MVGTLISSPPDVVKGPSEVSFGSKGDRHAAAKYRALRRLNVLSRSYSAGAFLIRPPVFRSTQASRAGFVAASSRKSTGYTPVP